MLCPLYPCWELTILITVFFDLDFSKSIFQNIFKMQNNSLSRYKRSPATSSVKKGSQSHMRIESFDKYFEDVMARKNNEYAFIDSPHLNQRLNDIQANINDHYLSAISTPTSAKVLKRIERKKYVDLKQKIGKSVEFFKSSEVTTLKELFEYKQVLLNEFLNEFTSQIEKQCRQKGEILKFIWNSMFGMIEHISEQLSMSLKEKEQLQLKNHIHQHKTYQEMIEGYKDKQETLVQKFEAYQITISKLVYELRFKRKEVNKLYKNQKVLLNRLNQFKNENLDIQSSYIDMMSSMRDVPPESVEHLLKVREEINRSKHTKLKINGNKKTNRAMIVRELKNDRTAQLNQLFEEIIDIANHQFNSPHIVSTLIEAAIDNFAIFNDDGRSQDQGLLEVAHKLPSVEAETQVDQFSFKRRGKVDQMVQFSYFDRLTESMICNKITQTFCDYGKKKILIDRAIGTDSEKMRKNYVDWNFRIVRVLHQDFWLPKEQTPNIIMSPVIFQRNHKKHFSAVNLVRGKLPKNVTKHSDDLNDLNDFQDPQEEALIRDSEPISQMQEFLQEVTDSNPLEKNPLKVVRSRKVTKMKMMNSSVRSFHPSYLKANSRKVSRQHSQMQLNMQNSQRPVPVSRFKERQTHQEPRSSVSPAMKEKGQKRGSSNQYSRLRSDFIRSNFLSTNNCFNIHIDEQKENQIMSFFSKKDQKQDRNVVLLNLEEEMEESPNAVEDNKLDNEVIARTLNHIDNLPVRSISRQDTCNSTAKRREARVSMQIRYEDENQLLMNVCRNNYFRRSKKKSREKKVRESYVNVRDQFTCVKDNIEMIARDVKELIFHKEEILKRTYSNKNLKNMYKILMMTFAKAYDCYNKGVVISNLVYPLFESFSLIYGAINTAEVYKKMINFIACISVKPDNTILRFFLFFLGLDRQSAYSPQVTISEVYLCLALLQKISIEGKVTLNIDSIYTDTTRIKEQLSAVLAEEKIPNHLCNNIKKRVDVQLQNSSTLRNSGDSETHFKINIYNIILLIIQEVIKSKSKLLESFTPILQHCSLFKTTKIVPFQLLAIILSMNPSDHSTRVSIDHLLGSLKKNNTLLSCQQFCSILFEHDIDSVEQVLDENTFLRYRWRIPDEFINMVRHSVMKGKFSDPALQFEFSLLVSLIDTDCERDSDSFRSIQVMKRLIFTKHYFQKVKEVLGADLGSVGQTHLF